MKSRKLPQELRITLRRTIMRPDEKRGEYIGKLDEIITRLEFIINSEFTEEKMRLRAVDTLTRVIKAAYTMVKDVEIEDIDRQVHEIEEMMEKAKKEPQTYR
jgi:flagellin-specific chaperone FliS